MSPNSAPTDVVGAQISRFISSQGEFLTTGYSNSIQDSYKSLRLSVSLYYIATIAKQKERGRGKEEGGKGEGWQGDN